MRRQTTPLLVVMSALLACTPSGTDDLTSGYEAHNSEVSPPPSEDTLTMGVSAYAPGTPTTYVVTGGVPGDEVYVLHGPNAEDVGLCPDVLSPDCLHLDAPVWVAASGSFDSSGIAALTYTLPAARTDLIGREAHIQAVQLGALDALVSPLVTRVIQSPPCVDEDMDGLCDAEILDWETACGDAIVDGVELCFAFVADVEDRPDITTVYYMTTVPIVGWQFDVTDGLFSGVSGDAAGGMRVFVEGTVAIGISLTLTPIEPGTGVLVRLGWDDVTDATTLSAIAVLEDATEASSLIVNDGHVML